MEIKLAVIPGDGVGPEMMEAAELVIGAVARRFGHRIQKERILACGAAIEETGFPLPLKSLEKCLKADAVLLGNTGLEKYKNCPLEQRPEYALLRLRQEMGLTTNIRPVRVYRQLAELSPLKERVISKGVDYVFVRDIAGGILCSEKVKGNGSGGPEAYEYEYYNQKIIEKTARVAFELAMGRKKQVVSLDKANVLESSRLWRKIVTEVAEEFPEVSLTHGYIDSAAMQLLQTPEKFDVILTSNMFGDIISDEGTGLTGTGGLYGSAELSASSKGLYTPNQLHNPDEGLIGKQMISPVGMIAAAAYLFRCSLGLESEAGVIEKAVESVLEQGYVTGDMKITGGKVVTTREMGERIAEEIEARARSEWKFS